MASSSPPPQDDVEQPQTLLDQNPNKEGGGDDDVAMITKSSDRTSTSDKEEVEDGNSGDDGGAVKDKEGEEGDVAVQEEQLLLMKRRRRRNRICCGCFCCIMIIVIVLASLYAANRNNFQSVVPLEEYLEILDSYQINPNSSSKDIQNAMKEMISRYDDADTKCQSSETILGITTTKAMSNSDDNAPASQQSERMYVTSSSSINADTLYEIGSISKPITGLVLSYQLELGLIESLDTPVNDFLPDDIPLLEVDANKNPVTFKHLVSHTSGLPRLPAVLMQTHTNNEEVNPYEGYTTQQLLEQITIAANNGLSHSGEIEYSNFGFAILGYLLGATNPNQSFKEFQQNLTQSLLNMTSTYIGDTIPSEIASSTRLLKGYNRRYPNKVMPYWYDGGVFIDGAGSTLSSASDLLTLAETLMMYYDYENDNKNATNTTTTEHEHLPLPLKNAIRNSLQTIKELDEDFTTETGKIFKQGIASSWLYEKHNTTTSSDDDDDIDEKYVYGHAGGTQGFTSNLVFNPNDQMAAVALTNCGSNADIGLMSSLLLRRLSGLEDWNFL